MELTSQVFENGGYIPSRYTCDGKNIHPPLAISHVPSQAHSLVLFVEDPDVPLHLRKDGLWIHWVVFNIDPKDQQVEEGVGFSTGKEALTTYGKPGFGGPCPPDREHRYFFRLYALDTKLDLDEHITKFDIEDAMQGHVIEETELMGRYERV